jgi:hypothetical protein
MANVYFESNFVSGTGAGINRIYIDAAEIREMLTDTLIEVDKPIASEAIQNSTDPSSRVKDIKRISHVIQVKGYVSSQIATIGGSSTNISSIQAKNYFYDRILWRGISTTNQTRQLKFYYRGGTFSSSTNAKDLTDSDPSLRYDYVFIKKVEFKDVGSARCSTVFGSYEDVQRYEFTAELVRARPL